MNKTFLLALAAGLMGGAIGGYLFVPKGAAANHKETAYERVMRTNTLRCGYWSWPPILKVGADGKGITGIFKDYTEALGKSLNLKVEWTREVSFAEFGMDIKTGKVDAVCGGVWPVAERGRDIDFVTPIYYIPIRAYARANDMRFDNNLKTLNTPNVIFSGMDGLVGLAVVDHDFPQAKQTVLPDKAGIADVFNLVATGKADATLNDVFTAQDYMDHNPGKLREVKTDKPLRYFGNTIAIGKDEYDLKRMLDNATEQLIYSGEIDNIIDKYEKYPGSLLHVARPYEVQK